MPNSKINWNGVSSDTVGITIERFPNIIRASRKFDQVSVPGRNGDLFFFQDAYNNYQQDYEIFAGDGTRGNVEETFNDIVAWLCPQETTPTVMDYVNLTLHGYHQLIDSYEPNCIRLATFYNGAQIANAWNRYGKTILSYNCRPERFTLDAFSYIQKTVNPSLTFTMANPTTFDAKPVFRFPANLGVKININDEYIIQVNAERNVSANEIFIDCESQNCFGSNLENYNYRITAENGFPVLHSGENTITVTFEDGPHIFAVYPRWWTL